MTLVQYLNGVPVEFRKAIRGLGNNIRLGIFLALREHGELSFSEIIEKLDMKSEKAKISFHLTTLTTSALIEHKYRHQLGSEKFSFYTISKFGENLWANMLSSIRPPFPIKEMGDSAGGNQTEIKIELQDATEKGFSAYSDNISMPIIAMNKTKRRKLPAKSSDLVIYEKATIEAEK